MMPLRSWAQCATLLEEHLALAILDRITGMAEVDPAMLNALIEDVNTGEAALQELLAQMAEEAGIVSGGDATVDAEPQIDKAEELRVKWGVETGQLWELGEHRIVCGDCTSGQDVWLSTQGENISLCLTDPPYGQNQDGVPNDNPDMLFDMINGAVMNIPESVTVAVFFQSPRTFPVLLDNARNNRWTFERMLWLYKAAQCTFPWRGWILTSESILVFSRGHAVWLDKKPYSHDCYYLSEVSGELPDELGWHGSVKPLSVVRDLLSRIGGDVYDPFLGSGTTLIACEQLGRKCRAIEISPGYVAVALQRWADATGKEPKLMTS